MSGHHPDCYQSAGVPDGMPAGICDCRVLRMLEHAADNDALAQAAREQLDALARGDWEAAEAAGRRVIAPIGDIPPAKP